AGVSRVSSRQAIVSGYRQQTRLGSADIDARRVAVTGGSWSGYWAAAPGAKGRGSTPGAAIWVGPPRGRTARYSKPWWRRGSSGSWPPNRTGSLVDFLPQVC